MVASGTSDDRGAQLGGIQLSGRVGLDVNPVVPGPGIYPDAFNLISDSTPVPRDAIIRGNRAEAFEGAGIADGDRIDLSAIDAIEGTPGDQQFVFGGSRAGHLSLSNSGRHTLVQATTDDDEAFEFELIVRDGDGSHRTICGGRVTVLRLRLRTSATRQVFAYCSRSMPIRLGDDRRGVQVWGVSGHFWWG